MSRKWRIAGLVALAALAGAGVATLLVRDQLSRHRRNIFSPLAFKRLAALGHLSRAEASVDTINLLRDYLSWEPRQLLRKRATALLRRLEREAELAVRGVGGVTA